jgi:hypothetical protein
MNSLQKISHDQQGDNLQERNLARVKIGGVSKKSPIKHANDIKMSRLSNKRNSYKSKTSKASKESKNQTCLLNQTEKLTVPKLEFTKLRKLSDGSES